MASFTTRVELHEAQWSDYQTLHAQMESRGFSRQIKAGDGTRYHLPTAEYNYEGSKTKQEILDLAKAAANATGKKHAILVTEANGRIWFGLTKV